MNKPTFQELTQQQQAQYVADAINLYNRQRDIELLSLMARADNLIVLMLTAKEDEADENGNVRTELMVRSPLMPGPDIRLALAAANTMVQGVPEVSALNDGEQVH